MAARALPSVFVANVVKLRRAKQLHTAVQNALKRHLRAIEPGSPAEPEIVGVPGGRNDMFVFNWSGRRTVIEIFATASQVPQDLRLLEQADADARIGVILDPEIEASVMREYLHKRPNHFPFLLISEVLMPSRATECRRKLRALLAKAPRSDHHDESADIPVRPFPEREVLRDLKAKAPEIRAAAAQRVIDEFLRNALVPPKVIDALHGLAMDTGRTRDDRSSAVRTLRPLRAVRTDARASLVREWALNTASPLHPVPGRPDQDAVSALLSDEVEGVDDFLRALGRVPVRTVAMEVLRNVLIAMRFHRQEHVRTVGDQRLIRWRRFAKQFATDPNLGHLAQDILT